jgi:hypothetical protein
MVYSDCYVCEVYIQYQVVSCERVISWSIIKCNTYCICVVFCVVVLTSCDFRVWWMLTKNAAFVGYMQSFVVWLYAATWCKACVAFIMLLYGYLYSCLSHISCFYWLNKYGIVNVFKRVHLTLFYDAHKIRYDFMCIFLYWVRGLSALNYPHCFVWQNGVLYIFLLGNYREIISYSTAVAR